MAVRFRKFEMLWRDSLPSEPVREVYERPCANVTTAAQDLLNYFNSTRRPGERERTLVSARELTDENLTQHV